MPTERRTIVVSIDAAQAVSYQLPPDVLQYVQSVVASVDATAAGDVKPTLYVKTGNEVVIAAKRQSEAIPAGDTGLATWALRLDGDGGGGGGGLAPLRAVYLCNPAPMQVGSGGGGTNFVDWSLESGAPILDLTYPTVARFAQKGVFMGTLLAYRTNLTDYPGKTALARLYQFSLAGFDGASSGQSFPMDATLTGQMGTVTYPFEVDTVDLGNVFANRCQATIEHNVGVGGSTLIPFVCVLILQKVANL